jgi:hypothetical protein
MSLEIKRLPPSISMHQHRHIRPVLAVASRYPPAELLKPYSSPPYKSAQREVPAGVTR